MRGNIGVTFILGLMCTYIYPFDCYLKLKRYDRLTERTTGRIYSIEVSDSRYRRGERLHKIQYFIEGKEYINEPIYGTSEVDGLKVGDVVPILYDTEDVNKIIEETKFDAGKEYAQKNYNFAMNKVLPAALLITLLIILYFKFKY